MPCVAERVLTDLLMMMTPCAQVVGRGEGVGVVVAEHSPLAAEGVLV
jgi:hypothetical protein